ncbi:MAG: hypothetical protein WCK86_08105 [Planctomycetia bacterium]
MPQKMHPNRLRASEEVTVFLKLSPATWHTAVCDVPLDPKQIEKNGVVDDATRTTEEPSKYVQS